MRLPTWQSQALMLAAMAFFAAFVTLFVVGDGTAAGLWPIGFGTGAVLLAERRRSVPTLLALIGVLSVVALVAGGLLWSVSLAYTVGVLAEISLVWALMTRGGVGRPELRTPQQLARFLFAVSAGAVVGGAISAALVGLSGPGPAYVVALTVAVTHLASHLLTVPFICLLHEHRQLASRPEQVAQWLVTVAAVPLLFLPGDFPALAFLVLPLFGWAALRLRPREVLLQVVLVLSCAALLLPMGRGPFVMVPSVIPAEDAGELVLVLFACICALTVVPLMLTVGEQLAHARQVTAERDKLSSIVGGAGAVAIIGVDEDGLINLFNPGAERLLGYAAAEVTGRPTQMFHLPETVSAKARELGVADDFVQLALALTGPGQAGVQMGFLRKDGVERQHALTLSRMTDDGGTTTGFVSISEDITDRLRAEAALRDALAAEHQAVTRLQEIDHVKDSFVSSVSHELRTPITSIVGYLELLEDGSYGALAPAQLDAVRRVSANSDRLLDLIDDLLTLSRLNEDGITVTPRAFDLRQAVRCGWAVVEPARTGRLLTLALDLPEDPVPLLGDKEMIERVVVNLLGNAVKFTPDGGAITTSLRVVRGEARLVVSDTGIGIPAQEQALLFTRFFRSTTAQKWAIPGSGLGLSITRAIVEKHGGSVQVDSEEEKGSTFDVRLPVIV